MTIGLDIKKGAILLAALSLTGALGFTAPDRPIRQGSLEFTIGSYKMNEPRFDAVYPSGGLMAGLTLSSALVSDVNFYLEIKYYAREGALTFSKEKTTLYLIPIDLGVRYIFPLGLINPYAGFGADFYFYYEDNPIGTVLNYANGYHLMGGAYLRFSRSVPVMLNLKLKYTLAEAEEKAVKLQLGGLEYAVGLAFTF
ncbi:MAG: hypothetical protein AB1715_04155 [Acidobacteriota bacterium]